MAFRDDREAMRARLDAAESDLADARRELAALRGATMPDAAPEEAVEDTPSSDDRSRRRGIWAVGAVVLVGGAIAAAFATRASSPTAATFRPATVNGVVAAASGLPDLTVGTACSLQIAPVTSGRFNCRLDLQCGGRRIYGGGDTGFTLCGLRGRVVERGTDARTTGAEGDPAITFDLTRGTLRLTDDVPHAVSLDVSLVVYAAR